MTEYKLPSSNQQERTHPAVSGFLNAWAHSLPRPDAERLVTHLLDLPNTITPHDPRPTLIMFNWLVRTAVPAWLDLANLTEQADALRFLPLLTSTNDDPAIPLLDTAITNAHTAVNQMPADKSKPHWNCWTAIDRCGVTAAFVNSPPELTHHTIRQIALQSAIAAQTSLNKDISPTLRNLQQSAVQMVTNMVSPQDPTPTDHTAQALTQH